MIEYLKNILTEKGYEPSVDKWGNVYVTKGTTEWYPCFVAHTDTVHKVNKNLTVLQEETNGKVTLRGVDGTNGKALGIGGDDKCGIYLALEMLDTLPNVKVALFVSEEIGCKGSQHADPEFFKNVGYAIQYDSPEGDSMSLTLMGRYLFNQKSEFADKVGGLITESGIKNWAYHPYTDVWQIMEKFNIACLNLAAGYYRYHTENEYVVVDEVQNGFELGLKLVETLGENRYENPKEQKVYSYGSYWRGYSKPKDDKKLLNEGKKEEKKEEKDEWDDIFNSGDFLYSSRGGTGYGPYYNRFRDDDDWY
jgi:putative aminopeptidase FrvX